MAVARDSVVTPTAVINGTSFSWGHTLTQDGLLVVGVGSGQTNPIEELIAPTVDSVGMTPLFFGIRDNTGGGTAFRLGAWYRFVEAGERIIQYTGAGEVQFAVGGSIAYTGVDPVTPFGTVQATEFFASPANPQVTVASAADAYILSFLIQNSQATRDMLPVAPLTERIDCFASETSPAPWLKAADRVGDTSANISWANTSGTCNGIMMAVSLNAAAGGSSAIRKARGIGSGGFLSLNGGLR